MTVVRLMTVGLALAVSSATASGESPDGEPAVRVWLESGRQFAGQIDASTDGDWFILRTAAEGITIRRRILWRRLVRAEMGGQSVSIAQLRRAVPPPAERRARPRWIELGPSQSGPAADGAGALLASGGTAPPSVKLSGISLDAAVENWDADVETDGLLLELMPFDNQGNLVVASGTLEVEFYAPRRHPALDLAPRSGVATVELVERWTTSVAAADFTPRGLRLRLPFGAVHPGTDPAWAAWWYGLVHVRFSVPGQGVFGASRDGVRIRPWAPTRDRLEMHTGQRLLPAERL